MKRYAYYCPACGSSNVGSHATASWDIEAQKWVHTACYEEMFCRECGHDDEKGFEPREIAG